MRAITKLGAFTIGFFSFTLILPAMAQVISDGTTNTVVNQSGNNFNIFNGIQKGNNLFHSFSNFSIPAGSTAIFNNAADVQNIFSRVTAGSVSNIDGLIQANGSANLFLLNPSGIIFGSNAQLNIGGSFIGTTAESIKFADGVEFSAINPQITPLLTINAPIGLQLGSNPAPINVQGTGHSLSNPNPSGLPPIIVAPSASELRVQPEQTLALVGGNLHLNGATLTAQQGQVELGSVSGTGLVSLIPTAQGYTLGYENGQSFGDIQLAQRSLLDVSGVNAGSVQVQGRHIKFIDGSVVLAQNFGYLAGGEIHLQASAAIDMIGRTDAAIWSGIRSETFGSAAGGNIRVITPKLTLQEGAGLNSSTVGTAASGNIEVQATAIELSGFSPINPTGISTLSTSSYYSSGNAGDIFVNGNSLVVSGGASLSSATFGSGSSGKVTIRNNHTTVMGENPFGLYSSISSTTFAMGNAKILTLDTAKLQILDGGVVAATTFFIGNGGDLSINATESIEISGRSRSNNSSINSSVLRLDPQFQQLFGLPDILIANAGNVNITTPNLTLMDGGTVSVTSQGRGNGGSLNITANTIKLDRQTSIQAATESGNGGNIALEVGKLLILRGNSAIVATAGGNGNGGNININAPLVVGLENSDIIANAVQGRGGNIQITTQGKIGLQFRPELTLENDITASSQFGISGTVQINNLGVDPNSGLIGLPANVTDPSQQIATGCANDQGSKFVATGRGGVPQNPTQEVTSDRTWSDIRDLSTYRKNSSITPQITQSSEVLIQATSWHRNAQGKIELIADKSPTQAQQPLTCAAVPKS
ncbi:filamentous hemagglutinin [Nostoc sp. ATCC 53789]|uniref:beta strand repeat-containing protein n=2 Tax=Nostoc sp. ATCC 53789 TaxID=76335 RepID=UPI000DECCE62|nr:filamentous hemagglutinin N-terminal domain-containing protein [Nostoc sp. ATCC 53789]RCJ25547.1 filamentous hemagglutinin [Nostoc sp. ATCC 53789]